MRYFLRGLEPSVNGTRGKEKESSLISQHLIVFIGIVCTYRAGHINSRMTVIFHNFSYLQLQLFSTSSVIYTRIHTYIHTYIHTSRTLQIFIWICVRYKRSHEDVVIMCIIFCITFCIVASNFAAICIFTCGPTWKLLTDISKVVNNNHMHTFIHTFYIHDPCLRETSRN